MNRKARHRTKLQSSTCATFPTFLQSLASYRLDEMHYKQKQLARKSDKFNQHMEKEKLLMKIREQRVIGSQKKTISTEEKLLSVLRQMEKETGMAETRKVTNEFVARRMVSLEETERLINRLIDEGKIYEPRKGYLKST